MFSKNTLFFPKEFIDAFINLTDISSDSKLLEIRTVKKLVNLPLFYRDFNILSVDLYPDKNLTNSVFQNLTLDKANFPTNSFDLIYATKTLHELSYSFFEKTFEILKPTGKLAIIEIKPLVNYDNVPLKEFDERIISKYFKTLYKRIDQMDFSKPTFKSIHFRHQFTSIYYTSKWYNTSEYLEDIMKGFPEIENLPTSTHNSICEELDKLIIHESGKLKRRYAIILYVLQKKEIQLKLNIDI